MARVGAQSAEALDYAAHRETQLERLADMIDAHLDRALLDQALGLG